MIINLPIDVENIIEKLETQGFQAYAVGGCIRDSLLGKNPYDWDISTSAKPNETKECFKGYKVLDIGIKHGTITVIINDKPYEITTFRVDGEYLDNRRPESVSFVNSLKQDLARRDFTVNAMAYNEREGLKDYFDGCSDLSNGIIRCVGAADKRFEEDALRIIRALRFASVLGFEIEDKTKEGLLRNRELLNSVAKERIMTELSKLLLGKDVSNVLAEYVDVISVFIPEIIQMVGFNQNNPHHFLDVWHHSLRALEFSNDDLITRLAILFHDIAKPRCYICDENGIGHFYGHAEHGAEIARDILCGLKFDGQTVNCVCQLIKFHDADISPQEKFIKRWLNKIGEEQLRRLIEVKKSDVMAQSEHMKEHKSEKLWQIEYIFKKVLMEKQCYSLKDLAVNGNDLKCIGIAEGRAMGEILDFLLEQVIDGNLENNKSKLIESIRNN